MVVSVENLPEENKNPEVMLYKVKSLKYFSLKKLASTVPIIEEIGAKITTLEFETNVLGLYLVINNTADQ